MLLRRRIFCFQKIKNQLYYNHILFLPEDSLKNKLFDELTCTVYGEIKAILITVINIIIFLLRMKCPIDSNTLLYRQYEIDVSVFGVESVLYTVNVVF